MNTVFAFAALVLSVIQPPAPAPPDCAGAVPMERFEFPAEYDEFFAYGPGAFFWALRAGTREPVMLVVLPGDRAPRRLYVHRSADDWSRPGPVEGHDGPLDPDRPTLLGSIQTGRWHGYIRGGELVPADCGG